jgi:sulfoxide reductase catalytic subunit YedY
MLITRRRGWEIAEAAATDPSLLQSRAGRRAILRATAGSLAAAALTGSAFAATAIPPLDPRYPPGRPITPAKDATTYNNFYEFGEDKDIVGPAQSLKITPWAVELKGLIKQPRTIALDDLKRQMPLEQRVLRHRCVEAWAMTVPWTGFPLARLIALADPLSSAKYVSFTTADQPDNMPGLGQSFYPWPYTEGLALDEATNDLAFMATGMYGADLPKQDGAPIRLLVPWKYGFKSAKSIVTLTFTAKRPATFWESLGPSEYGFWANVNPAVPHPRWSQARERLLGSDEMVPTQLYNGYGEFVASLYKDRQGEDLFR